MELDVPGLSESSSTPSRPPFKTAPDLVAPKLTNFARGPDIDGKPISTTKSAVTFIVA